MEYCDDEKCMKLADPKSPPIKVILTNINDVKNLFRTQIIDAKIGEGFDSPAVNCTIIKVLNFSAPNG